MNTGFADLYLAYFGRPPDFEGTAYYLDDPFAIAADSEIIATGDILRLVAHTATTVLEAVEFITAFDMLPEWGWWTAYYPRHPVLIPRRSMRAQRRVRHQARACAKQRRHWKRRRFVQKLRSRA